jgi:hypothetical protein
MPHSGLYHWPGDSLGEVEVEGAWLNEMGGVSEVPWESWSRDTYELIVQIAHR